MTARKRSHLPPERPAEVASFVDSLRQRSDDRALTRMATTLSEGSFERIWDNADDAEYDLL